MAKSLKLMTHMLLVLTFSSSAFALTNSDLISCRREDELILLASSNYMDFAINNQASPTTVLVFFNSFDAKQRQQDPYVKKMIQAYKTSVNDSNSCSELRKKLTHYFRSELNSPEGRAQLKKINSGVRKTLPENKEILNSMGLLIASKTLSTNEFLLNITLSLTEVGIAFGNKGGDSLGTVLSSIHPDLNIQHNRIEELRTEEFNKLAEEFGGSVPTTEPRLIQMDEKYGKLHSEIKNQIQERNSKLTAQQIEKALVLLQAQETISNWKKALDK